MNFDRFDICEAYYIFATLWHGGQSCPIYRIFWRLNRMKFKPSPVLNLNSLTDNGREIYFQLCEKHGFEDVENEMRN